MAIAIPVLMLILFGYALSLDVDRVPLVAWDRSRSHASRELLARFDGSRYFDFRGLVGDYSAIERAIDERKAVIALVIDHDFASRLESGRTAGVQAVVDASDPNTATLAISYAEAVTRAFSSQSRPRPRRAHHRPRPSSPPSTSARASGTTPR